MAAVMGALGARDALMLSALDHSGRERRQVGRHDVRQLMIRDSAGAPRVWNGTRSVPLGLVGRARR